jgi:hypothetical protein
VLGLHLVEAECLIMIAEDGVVQDCSNMDRILYHLDICLATKGAHMEVV